MIHTAHRQAHGRVDLIPVQIRLPDPPFDIPPALVDETAPTARTIRGDRHWRQDKELGLALWRAGK